MHASSVVVAAVHRGVDDDNDDNDGADGTPAAQTTRWMVCVVVRELYSSEKS